MAKSIKKRIADKIKTKITNKVHKTLTSNLDVIKRLSDNNSSNAEKS
jgi:hypothetical protein